MSLKTADKYLSIFEITIVALSFAGWAALGFPEWKPVVALGLLCMIGTGVFQWFVSRRT
jgi:hypothetical protein